MTAKLARQYFVLSPDKTFSPYILTRSSVPEFKVSDEADLIKKIFTEIAHPTESVHSRYWKTELGQIHLHMMRLTLGAFIRKRFKKDFNNSSLNFKFRQRKLEDRKYAQALVKLETDLWLAVWRVLLTMHSRGCHHPAIVLYDLLQEPSGLLMCHFQYIPTGESENATDIIRKIQYQNRKLQGPSPFENPFDEVLQPNTYQFVKCAHLLGDESEEGRREWMTIVKARMRIATNLKGERGVRARTHREDLSIKAAGRTPKK